VASTNYIVLLMLNISGARHAQASWARAMWALQAGDVEVINSNRQFFSWLGVMCLIAMLHLRCDRRSWRVDIVRFYRNKMELREAV
jgi:hypothetical protein